MKEIKYTLTAHAAFLTEIDTYNCDTVTFRLEGEDDAILKIGDSTYEISHGVCHIHPSKIKDGVYIPELITDDGATPLDAVSVLFGVMKLCPTECEIARTSRMMLDLSKRIATLEEENGRLHDAVFGTKLF